MNKLRSQILLLVLLVTLSLIPAATMAAPTQVNVAGSFEASLGGNNWANNDALTDMNDVNVDGVWKFTATIPDAGDYAYKIVEDANWDLAYPASDVPFTVTGGEEVRWYYDEGDHYVADSTNQVIAAVVGDFVSGIGGNDWSPDHLMTWMKDPDGDGVYGYKAINVPEGTWQYKVALNESWDVSYPGSNKSFAVPPGGDDVIFYFDSATNEVWETVGEEPPPLLVTFPGDYVESAGLGNNWDPANLNTQASDNNGDGVWKFMADFVPAGNYNFKATVGGSWDENYGLNGEPNGPNVAFSADGDPVHFYYDRGDNYVASRPNSTIPVVAGDFVSEIGGNDWSPDHLKTWMKDPDGDGIYAYVAQNVPEGTWQYKVALNESWDVAFPGSNKEFTVPAGGASVTFTYNEADNEVAEYIIPLPDPGLAQPSVQHTIQDEIFYFLLPDRFDNGDTNNDEGDNPGGGLADHGFLPSDKSFYHGGDLAGLTGKLDYIQNLGATALWLTPVFENQTTQPDSSTSFGISAGYHGYWILDYENTDTHLGSNAELATFIEAAHDRGIKVYFDIVVNHTADVIEYEGGGSAYISKADFPYRNAEGNVFDDRDYVGGNDFPTLDPDVSFPYRPIFPDPGDDTAKNPAWLNEEIYYHNRGNSTYVGENSEYGDLIGLDDLFTEHPVVVNGFLDIYKSWIDAGVDGFRLDTAKHVNIGFWQQFAPEIMDYAASQGKADFYMFGEVFDGDPAFMSRYTTEGQLPGVLDFGLHGTAVNFAARSSATNDLRDLFARDDYFTDQDSNAYGLATFISNHDAGRLGFALREELSGAGDDELVARARLGYGLLFFARGFPVIYYGDEQGFTGGGSDENSREDMMPSLVAEYNDNDLIGTSDTTAQANFDETHPIYQALDEYASILQDHLALRRGAQIHRYSSDSAGIYAFSRLERDEKIEYLLAFNNSLSAQTATFGTFMANTNFAAVYPSGGDPVASNADKQVAVEVPALSFVIYKADAPLSGSEAAPMATFVSPAAGAGVFGRTEVGVALDSGSFAEVTFVVKEGDGDYEVIGTDNNPPYRVFYDVSSLAPGTPLVFGAIADDTFGHRSVAVTAAAVGMEEPPAAGTDHAIVHYLRSDGDYGDHTAGNDYWGLHLWGDAIDPSEVTEWPTPKPFLGEDEYGRFTWIKLADPTLDVNFIVHRGNDKDGTEADRSFNPIGDGPEIWLKQDDGGFYTSQAAAQGYATIHYQRPDGVYDGWGLHLWGEAIDPSEGTDWANPRLPDGSDDYGVFFNILLQDPTKPLNFIVHRGDDKDPADSPDRSFIPVETATIWLKSGDVDIYAQRGAAEGFALLHYRRDAGDYGNYDSGNFNDFWGLHTWAGADDPGWTTPRKPLEEQDVFGVVFKVPLFENASEMGYIFHKGDEKDPGPDQFLVFEDHGYEVWQLQSADPENPYIYPLFVVGGPNPGNIDEQRAYWVNEDTIAWAAAEDPANNYRLHYAAEGGLDATETGITGGDSIALTLDPLGLPADVQDKFPHLAGLPALKISAGDLDLVPTILKGQIAVSAVTGEGLSANATGLQIPGVLDDLYSYDGPLGVSWEAGVPTVRVWAPTAKSVSFHLFDDADPATDSSEMAMSLDTDTGVWSITGEIGWMYKYYLFEVEIYVHSTGQVEHNIVTDPYSLSLAMNSARSQLVDLADSGLAPSGWQSLEKPPLAAPEDITIYEIHVRDFSVNDPLVPDELKGTFKAFTLEDSYGMRHLKALAEAGLSHLHLLPVFDIATINENKAEWQAPDPEELATYAPDSEEQQAAVTATEDLDGFNWGYDPWHYTTPEGSYATDPNGFTRIVEFREMVQALNQNGLRVVMDVVYNHTNAAGQDEKSVLDKIVPGYYHRLDDKGQVEISTCCKNTASEHNMMEKLMIDSLVTWAKYYKIDAFRFDLMGHHMLSNMINVRAALDSLTLEEDGVDGKAIYIYGEGWNFGEVADNARGVNATQLNIGGQGIGTFSDRLRDAVRGGGPFDSGEALKTQGFANGLFYDPNDFDQGTPDDQLAKLLLHADQIRVGMAGNLAGFQFIDRNGNLVTGADVDYNGQPAGYTEDPQEDITYISKHDNQTLFDINVYGAPVSTSMADRVRIQNVGLSTVLLGQGVPFMHAGSDLLRSKSLDRDSFNSGDWFNKLDFTYSDNNFGVGLPVAGKNKENWDIMQPLLANPALKPTADDIAQTAQLFQEWLAIRSSSKLFRLETAQEIQARLVFHNTGPDQVPGLIVMSISDKVGMDLDRKYEAIYVLINATDEGQSFTISGAAGMDLGLHEVLAGSVDPVVRSSGFDPDSGAFLVPARTTAVFVELAMPQERLGYLIDDVEMLVTMGSLIDGQGNALIVKLEGTIDALDRGNEQAAAGKLRAFINQVTAFMQGGILAEEEGQPLIDQAVDIIAQIQSDN